MFPKNPKRTLWVGRGVTQSFEEWFGKTTGGYPATKGTDPKTRAEWNKGVALRTLPVCTGLHPWGLHPPKTTLLARCFQEEKLQRHKERKRNQNKEQTTQTTSKTPEGRSATFRVPGFSIFRFFTSIAARFLVSFLYIFFEPSREAPLGGLFFIFFLIFLIFDSNIHITNPSTITIAFIYAGRTCLMFVVKSPRMRSALQWSIPETNVSTACTLLHGNPCYKKSVTQKCCSSQVSTRDEYSLLAERERWLWYGLGTKHDMEHGASHCTD